MREIRLGAPQLFLIGATRGLLGVGIGLLLSGRLGRRRRRTVGATLAIIGGLSTIPLALGVLPRLREARAEKAQNRVDNIPASKSRSSSVTAS